MMMRLSVETWQMLDPRRAILCSVPPAKTKMTGWKKTTMNEDLFPIKRGDFPSHVNFPGCFAPVFGSEFIQHQHR